MRAAIAISFALLALVPAVPSASAATRHGSDRQNGVGMELKGRTLTIHVRPPRPNSVTFAPLIEDRDLIRGRVVVACGTNFRNGGSLVLRRLTWPAGVRKFRVRFRRDISRRAVLCLVESPDGGDITVVTFIRAERYRRVATAIGPSGGQWRFAARRGRFAEPCVALRAPNTEDKDSTCFGNFTSDRDRLGVAIGVPSCEPPVTYVFGAVSPNVAGVHVRTRAGAIHAATIFPSPKGSVLTTKLYALALKGRVGIARVRAFDAAGRTIGVGDNGVTPIDPDCGSLSTD